MQQMVLIVGVVLASAIGLALLALVLVTTFRNSHTASRSKNMNTPFIQDAVVFKESHLSQAIRGYDTPELYRRDERLRSQLLSTKSPDDMR
jgi:hypothetical protein